MYFEKTCYPVLSNNEIILPSQTDFSAIATEQKQEKIPLDWQIFRQQPQFATFTADSWNISMLWVHDIRPYDSTEISSLVYTSYHILAEGLLANPAQPVQYY